MLFLASFSEASLSVFLINILLTAAALYLAAYMMRGVRVTSFTNAIIVAVVLSLLNATLGAVLDFFTWPLRIITLGLFSFVVDAIVLLVAAYFLRGLEIRGFGSAFLLAILLAVINFILHGIFL